MLCSAGRVSLYVAHRRIRLKTTNKLPLLFLLCKHILSLKQRRYNK